MLEGPFPDGLVRKRPLGPVAVTGLSGPVLAGVPEDFRAGYRKAGAKVSSSQLDGDIGHGAGLRVATYDGSSWR